MGDQVLDGIRYMEERVIVETLKLSEAVGQATFHLGVITVISAPGWSWPYVPHGGVIRWPCTMSPPFVRFLMDICLCCKTLCCGAWVSSYICRREAGDYTDCGKWASILVLKNGPVSLGSSNACRKAALSLLWLPMYSKDRYILSPQELSAQSLSEMANSW